MLYTVLLSLLIAVSILLIVLVLMQRGTSEFALAFGSNPMQSIFGSTEADTILTKVTFYLGFAFLILALLTAVAAKKQQQSLLGALEQTPPVKVEEVEK